MSCLPNMPCWQNTVNPETTNSGCNSLVLTAELPCGCIPININSTNVIYSGIDLLNIDVNTNDNLTLILSKINDVFINSSILWGNITGDITNQIDLVSFLLSNYYSISNPDNYINLLELSSNLPLTYNSGTGTFSINQSSTSIDGYLSSTDWNTFNNKVSGAAGLNTQIQYNNYGAFAGSSGLIYNSGTDLTTHTGRIVAGAGATDKGGLYAINASGISVYNGGGSPEIIEFANQDYRIYRGLFNTEISHRANGGFNFYQSSGGVESLIAHLDGATKKSRFNVTDGGNSTVQTDGGFFTWGNNTTGNAQNIITGNGNEGTILGSSNHYAYNLISAISSVSTLSYIDQSLFLGGDSIFAGFSTGTRSLYNLLIGNHNNASETHHLVQFGTGLLNNYGLATWGDWTFQPKIYFGNNNVVYTNVANKASFVIANGFLSNGSRGDASSYSSHSFTHFTNGWTQINTTNNGFISGGTTLTETDVTPKAALEVVSTTSGFLPPKMTATQAEAISSPPEGLLVYSTDGAGSTITSKGWWGWSGAAWEKLN